MLRCIQGDVRFLGCVMTSCKGSDQAQDDAHGIERASAWLDEYLAGLKGVECRVSLSI